MKLNAVWILLNVSGRRDPRREIQRLWASGLRSFSVRTPPPPPAGHMPF